MTVHFVYIKGDSTSTPFAITREVAERVARRYPLKVYDFNERHVIHPEPGDILIGHPNLGADTAYNASFHQPGWARRIVFSPFAHAMLEYNGYTDPFAVEADIYLAICGKYWIDTNERSAASHWHYKMVHCDLAINREHFPQVKFTFNPPSKRKFLYIGRTIGFKGIDFLCRIAEANPSIEFGWIGEGTISSKRIKAHGGRNFSTDAARQLVAQYDFLITCGRSDANPTTILEAAAWGLVPVATLQSGYYEDDWLVNIPLDDVPGASEIIRHLNECSENELIQRRNAGFEQLDRHYNWDRVAQQVFDVLEMPIPKEPTASEWHLRKRRNQAVIHKLLRRAKMKDIAHAVGALPRRVVGKLLRVFGLRR